MGWPAPTWWWQDRAPIAMFLDCSKSSDATGLVAARISDGHVVTLGVWQSPRGMRGQTWLVPRHEVDAVVRAAFAQYSGDVVRGGPVPGAG